MFVQTRIGPYELLAPIGSGGMGEVYRAHDPRLDRDIALKILSDDFASNAVAIERFKKEAKAVAALSHPNIVTIFDCGFDDGLFYIATELLKGQTLRDLMNGKPVPWKRAYKIALSVAEALRAAHSRGIVHRDLKPENIFITTDGLVKILDFGLAHMSPDFAAFSEVKTLTAPGTIVGTPGYMSPEQQTQAADIDVRSDIFSFGCVLYEMLSGKRAFPGRSLQEIITSVLRDEPDDLRTLCPDVPEELVRVVEHCLEKRREERFQACSDIMFALTSAADLPSKIVSASASPKRLHKRLPIVPVAVLLATLALTVYLGRRSYAPAPASTRAMTTLAVMPLANMTGNRDFEFVADGLTQGIINNLSPVRGFTIRPWNSVSYYKDRKVDAREIRSDLGADAVVVGDLTRQADKYIVSVQLIDARENGQIWGHRYSAALTSDIERELSGQIAGTLQMQLSQADSARINRRATTNPEADRQYKLGLYEIDKRTPEGLQRGIAYFRAAVQLDPRFAEAWAGIAESLMFLGGLYEVVAPAGAMPDARKAAEQALALDPTSAEAHTALANIKHEYDWNWPQAEQEFKRAIELNPNYGPAHQLYGQALVYRGRFTDGLRELERAGELNPLSLVSRNDIAQAYWIAGDYDKAIAQARSIIDTEPRFWLAHWILGLSLAGKNDLDGAAASLTKAVELGGTAAVRGSLGYVYGRSGRRAEAVKILNELRSVQASGRYVSPAAFVIIYEGLGEKDLAWQEVERAYRERVSLMTAMHTAPIAAEVRRDPRYPEFARRVGLPPLP